jgi:5-methylcytosine-specific restriction endonuclease McrA
MDNKLQQKNLRREVNSQKKKRKLRRQADKIWTEIILKKHNYKCEVCGEHTEQVHHFVPKSQSKTLRLDLDNGIPICQPCHFAIHTKSDPFPLLAIRANRGNEWYKEIKRKRQIITKETIQYLTLKIKDLTKDLYKV